MAASRETLTSSLSTHKSATWEGLVWRRGWCGRDTAAPESGADRPFAEVGKQRPGPSESWHLIDPGGRHMPGSLRDQRQNPGPSSLALLCHLKSHSALKGKRWH